MSTHKEMVNEPHQVFDTLLILDFGSQYTHIIARRLRELNVYSEMLPCTTRLSDLSWTPKGIILSGGPYSVYAPDAPHVDPAVFESVPLLGICYGLQELAWYHAKDNVVAGERREYGHARLAIQKHPDRSTQDRLFDGLGDRLEVWMSHGDKLSK